MQCEPTAIAGVFEIHSTPQRDHRGAFRRSWCRAAFEAAGMAFSPVQASLSENLLRHTLRGMHYQTGQAQEQKLVRCLHGRIFDVALDLRAGSPTHGQYWAMTLSAGEGNALFIPRGCAHGFLTLSDEALVEYLIDVAHAPAFAQGCRWNDRAFGINWPAQPAVISERDRHWPDHV